MAKVWHRGWGAGTFKLLDGRVITYTPADVRAGVERLREMVRAGLAFAVCDGHTVENRPRLPTELSADVRTGRLNTVGQVLDARLDRAGHAEFLLDVPDRNKDKFRGRFVSVQVDPEFQHGDRRWVGNTLANVALCYRPLFSPAMGQRAIQLSADAARRGVVQLGFSTRRVRSMTDTDLTRIIEALKRFDNITIPDTVDDVEQLLLCLDIATGGAPEEGAEGVPPSPVSMSRDRAEKFSVAAAIEGAKRYATAANERMRKAAANEPQRVRIA